MVVQAFNGTIESPKEYFNDQYNDDQLDSSVLYVTSFVTMEPNFSFEETMKIAVLDANGNEITDKTVDKILYLDNNSTEDGYNWSYTGAISGFTEDDVNNEDSAVTVCFYYEVDGVKYGVKSDPVIYDGTSSVE